MANILSIIEESFDLVIIAFKVQKQFCQTKISEIMPHIDGIDMQYIGCFSDVDFFFFM